MHAEIVTTGTELLLGVIVDTNSTWIARQLRDIGLNLFFITSAGDNQERVSRVIDTALDRSDVVITTGGLGPTVDDVTREAVAQATGRDLVLDPALLASIEAFFKKRGYAMSENNRRQARIPRDAIPLENPVGTAPCFIVQDERGIVISLPGVPHEMKYMMTHVVLPYLCQQLGLAEVIKMRTLKTTGVGESTIDSLIADLEESDNPTIGLAAHLGQIDIRITAKADDPSRVDAMLADMEARVRERVGDIIFGTDQDTLESVVLRLLQERVLTLAVAEVNTGGLISGRLERVDPQGRVFCGGWVLPGSRVPTGSRVTAEGEQAALGLAQDVCAAMEADVGLAVVNVGPDDVHMLVRCGTEQRKLVTRFRGYEEPDRRRMATYGLDLVRRMCLELDM